MIQNPPTPPAFAREWQGTPYTESSAATYCDVVQQGFGRAWLEEAGASDPIRRAWGYKDHQSTIYLCRIGRDLIALDQQHDEQQLERLTGMIEQQIKKDLSGSDNYLYELHIATLVDPSSGALGKLAKHGSAGYDIAVRYPGNRTMWVSCKRLVSSDAEARFREAAAQVVSQQRTTATAHGYQVYDSLVCTGEPLTPESDTSEIAKVWEALCQRFTAEPLGVTHAANDLFVALFPNAYATTLSTTAPMATIDRANRAQVVSPIPKSEHRRITKRYKEAVAKFKDTVPPPSPSDIRVVAIDVPESVPVWAVYDNLARRFAQGTDPAISAVLLTRAVPTTVPAFMPRHTMAEEYYLILNPTATVTLQDFLSGDHLVLRVEGQFMPQEMHFVCIANGQELTLPPGYLFTDDQHPSQITFPFDANGRATVVLPTELPRVVLDANDLAAPDSEVAWTLI